MPGFVKVEDFEVFRLFRVALLKFTQAAGEAISSADAQVAGTHSWLEGEASTHWQSQLRKRTEMVTKARDAVRQKKLYKDSTGRTPSAVDEEKHLARCLAAADEAQNKIVLVKKWIPRLEKETELYRGGVSRLADDVRAEIPRAVALLDRLAATLEEYVQIQAPGATLEPTTMAVDGETGVQSEAVEEAKEETTPVKKEGGDVADGK